MVDRRPTHLLPAGLAAAAGTACLAIASIPGDSLSPTSRAWLLTLGFGLLTAGVLIPLPRHFAPVAVALVFFVYGGFSAVIAVPNSPEKAAENAKTLTEDQIKASQPSADFQDPPDESDFGNATRLTALAGFLAIAGSWGFFALWPARRARAPGVPKEIAAARAEWIGKGLVVAGFIGVFLALLRFAATQIPTDDLFLAFKSMWEGGSYFLLLATFAIPGFGLWLLGAVQRGAPRREYLIFGAAVAGYLALLVPTNQRGFAIAIALMALTVLVFQKLVSLRMVTIIAVLGIVALGASQAARDEIRETGTITPGNYASRIVPSEWKDLYGSQLASFNWTVQVADKRDRLDIPNPYPRAFLKPIPRQIYPAKTQGFGTEFTARVYPEAARQHVSFAIPMPAESFYAFGVFGMALMALLFGVGASAAERRFATSDSVLVRPVVLATIGWCVFVLMRGDFANAIVVGSGWVIPLVLFSRALGLRSEPRVKKLVIDALQVAPQFSGVGRQVLDIGVSLKETMPSLPVTVRCAADVEERLREVFPDAVGFETPIRSSRPRLRRIFQQQVIGPIRDKRSTILLALGDQAPVWGRPRLIFGINDVRRIARPDTAGGRVESAFYSTVLRAGARRAERIITVSEFSRAEILRDLRPVCPIEVVASRLIRTPLAGEPGGASGPFLIVSALRPYKSHETAIEALGLLRERGRNGLEVVCVGGEEAGSGWANALTAKAQDAGVEDSFRIYGWASDDELTGLYESSVGTINPSAYEGYGLPVAESITHGKPTIASDIPPHREVGGEAALYFPQGDAAELAKRLEEVADDATLRAGLAERAALRARDLEVAEPSWGPAIGEAISAIAAESPSAGDGDAGEARPTGHAATSTI